PRNLRIRHRGPVADLWAMCGIHHADISPPEVAPSLNARGSGAWIQLVGPTGQLFIRAATLSGDRKHGLRGRGFATGPVHEAAPAAFGEGTFPDPWIWRPRAKPTDHLSMFARPRLWPLVGFGRGSLDPHEADMLAAFPVLAELRGALPDVQEVRDSFALPCRKSLAWGYHVEAILLWWLRVTGEGGGQAPPAHVWVIEDPTTPDTPALTWARSWRRTRRTARTCWRTASTRGARLDLAGRRVRGLLGAGWGPPRALRGARAAPLGRRRRTTSGRRLIDLLP
ncbi:unnamed protein product, partial [Prorocentrum cordatum]